MIQTLLVCTLAAVLLVAVRDLRFRPYCPFCGKTFQHARDCPSLRR